MKKNSKYLYYLSFSKLPLILRLPNSLLNESTPAFLNQTNIVMSYSSFYYRSVHLIQKLRHYYIKNNVADCNKCSKDVRWCNNFANHIMIFPSAR